MLSFNSRAAAEVARQHPPQYRPHEGPQTLPRQQPQRPPLQQPGMMTGSPGRPAAAAPAAPAGAATTAAAAAAGVWVPVPAGLPLAGVGEGKPRFRHRSYRCFQDSRPTAQETRQGCSQ